MANFYAPHDPRQDKYGILGDVLGQALGGLSSYAIHEYKKPEVIKQFMDNGANESEAKILANMPAAQQQQWLQARMKMKRDEQKLNALRMFGDVSNTQPTEEAQTQQNLTLSPEQENKIRQVSMGLSPDQKKQILYSGIFSPSEIAQFERVMASEKKQEFAEKAFEQKEKTEAYKLTSPYRAEITKQAENADHLVQISKEQKKLADSGKMDSALYITALDRLGLPDALKSPETQAFQSMEKEYLKDLKSIFGGRISNLEMSTFLKSIPRATNSPEAQKMIMDRLDAYYKAKQLKFKTMRQIIKNNNGIPPLDLQEQVQEKTAKKEKQYAEKFKGLKGGEKEPDPTKVKRYRDTETGQIMVSNGREFVPEG